MSMCRVFSCVVGRGCLLWPVHSLGKTLISLCPASFHTPRPNLPVIPGVSWLPICILCRSVAVKSYPSPKVRGSNRECQAVTVQEQRPRGASLPPRSSSCAGTGGLRGATPRSRSGEVAVRRYPSSMVRSSTLWFAGAAMKRYPTSEVRETQVRW